MNKISNADKQARFRKKEQLKRHANNILREWQAKISLSKSKSITPEDVQYALDKATDLPFGWTDQDYESAVQALAQLHTDLCFTSDQLKNDVDASWNSLMTTSDPLKYISDNKAAIENARVLASHLISGLRLSNCNDADQAAALMEVLRFVGRSLATNPDIERSHTGICPRSQAITICLAIINPHYNRPGWFAGELAQTLHKQLGPKLAHEVMHHLNKLNHKDPA